MVERSTVVVPPVLSGAVASCWELVASSTCTVPVPVPDPPGEKMEVSTASELQAVTICPVGAPIGLEVALPLGKKLTGAEVSCTVFRLGVDVGVVSCARQRTAWTVSRKFRASVGDDTVMGKYCDQKSLPPPEYGCRKLTQSETAPVEVRAIWRKSSIVVEELPSW